MRQKVLIFSNRDDIHAHAVIRKLREVSRQEDVAVLFDAATFPMASDVSIVPGRGGSLSCYPALPEMYGGGVQAALKSASDGQKQSLEFDQIRSVYWRRPRRAIVDDALEHRDLRLYVQRNSRETLEGFVEQLSLECIVVDPPTAVIRADLKVLQLEQAHRAGLRVPATLVTNNPAEAISFVTNSSRDGIELVSKSPADLHYFPAQTELVDEGKLRKIGSVRLSPTVLQHRITGGPDLRITVVGERLFGMQQWPGASAIVDSRLDPTPRRDRYEVPPTLAAGILEIQRRLGLSFGAYDFKCDEAGTPFFLEVNPVGQWLFAETAVHHPIAEALARYLWFGPGAEWQTELGCIETKDLGGLYPTSVQDEYRALAGEIEKLSSGSSDRPAGNA